MGEYNNFNYDFIERTLKILKAYHGPYGVTQMINCAVGLLVLPQQKLAHQLPITDVDDSGEFGIYKSNIRKCRGDYSFNNVLRHVRNGIVHGHITQVSTRDGEIESIKIEDFYRGQKTFEIVVMPNQLEQFAIYTAEAILASRL
ncbi:hypothetical protein C8U37_10869 [Trichococcus patagoniensis]|uniref:pEK499-p136 HEPN domain-containing protein n=1 Tax=Trichococcus patagoniensis TaxID=382641 RepID=A0A2T5IKZ9_9LACT|nr:HEPN family nuclease [Trichococcus patagoniensis]PTQ84502.1 hypothetical protein C8U37_10869 [Trichococcus patagoniensis]